jgi:hypothetical protein
MGMNRVAIYARVRGRVRGEELARNDSAGEVTTSLRSGLMKCVTGSETDDKADDDSDCYEKMFFIH